MVHVCRSREMLQSQAGVRDAVIPNLFSADVHQHYLTNSVSTLVYQYAARTPRAAAIPNLWASAMRGSFTFKPFL